MAIKPEDASKFLQDNYGLDPETADYHASQMYPEDPYAAYLKQQAGGGPNDWSQVPELDTGAGPSGNSHSAAPSWSQPQAAPPVNLAGMFPTAPTPPAAKPGAPSPKAAPAPWNAPKPATPAAAPTKEMAAQLAKQDRAENLKGATFATPDETATKPGALGPLVSKGGRTPHSWQVQEALDLPETVEAYGKADRSAREAALAQRQAGELDAQRQIGYLDQFSKAQEERAMRLKAQSEDRARRYDAEMDKLGQLTDEVRADKIDPSAFFTKNGTAGAFAASLAYALGAVGGALTRTENPVVGVIRDEIQAQKENAAKKRQRIDEQRGLLGQMARTFGDETIGEQAAWAAYLEKAKTDMQKIAGESQYDSVRAKYKDAIAGIDAHLAPTIGKLEELLQDRVVRQDVNAPAVYAGQGTGKLDKLTREEVGDIAKERQKAGLPAAMSELADIDRTLDAFGTGDIAGVGPVKNYLPNALISDEGVANRQAIAAVKNKVRKSIAGASLTEGEKVELDKQLEGAGDANSLRRVVQSLRQSLVYQDRNIRAIGSDEARAEYARREKAASRETIPLNKPSTPHIKRSE